MQHSCLMRMQNAKQYNSRPERTHLWLLRKGSSLFLAVAEGNQLQI
jgi:hypothetical protein